MNVLVVGISAMAAYLVLLAVWMRYDKTLDLPEDSPADTAGGEGQ